jgi:pseudouridine synthase
MPDEHRKKERLQKLMAHAGIASRRACEDLIRQGRVEVDGEVATLGQKADPDCQHIVVDGVPLKKKSPPVYVAVHKPYGVLSTSQDDRGRRTVRDLVPLAGHLYPVGRLDRNSEGLVLLTNDGALTNRLTHPRYEHEKEYRVLVEGQPPDATLARWERGVRLEDGLTAPAQVSRLQTEQGSTWVQVIMHEGRKRQIRRVAQLLGHPVQRLIRERIGSLQLGDLGPGQWRHLSEQEVKDLRRAAASRSGHKEAG